MKGSASGICAAMAFAVLSCSGGTPRSIESDGLLVDLREASAREVLEFRSGGKADYDPGDRPEEGLGFEEALRFANWRSAREGLSPAYAIAGRGDYRLVAGSRGYRLPTAAESEAAAPLVDGGYASPWEWCWDAKDGERAQAGGTLPYCPLIMNLRCLWADEATGRGGARLVRAR